MQRHVFGVLVGMLAATALIAAQTTAGQSTASQKSSSDITVTGCLTQGSSSTVYLLNNAKKSPTDKTEKGVSYVIVPGSEDLALSSNLNHEVEVTGSAEAAGMSSPASATSATSSTSSSATVTAQKPTESSLPRFSAKTLTLVSDRCTAQSH